VHRVVALVFCEKPIGKNFVNHKDMNKANNNYLNLEWVTSKENNAHARKNKVFKNGTKKGIDNFQTKSICQKNDKGEIIYLWDCVNNVSKHYGVSPTAIGRSCRNKKKSIGFFWDYISKDYYLTNNKCYNKIPIMTIDKRSRDLSKAQSARKDNLKKFTNEFLINIGVECFNKHGRIIRKEYDVFVKEKKSLTYIPTVRKFGTWNNYKKEVTNYIIKETSQND
jgi:hypothetical protein